jgi:predicted lipoprotein with Yx(FWY)xxD motif
MHRTARAACLAWLVLSLPVVVATGSAAEPDCSETARKDGKDQDGNTVNCLWTVCKEAVCDGSGDTIGDCRTETSYKDPRDCREPEEPADRDETESPR